MSKFRTRGVMLRPIFSTVGDVHRILNLHYGCDRQPLGRGQIAPKNDTDSDVMYEKIQIDLRDFVPSDHP
jgi:hypothetical protein